MLLGVWPALLPARLPEEDRPHPFTGYKLAHPTVSADGTRGAFIGLAMNPKQLYGLQADAVCLWTRHKAVPERRCECGFYCFHRLEEAEAMACNENHSAVVILEVAASGRFIRYERGLRYGHQRVRNIRLGRCLCGAPADVFADTGRGLTGWRRLQPACTLCSRRGGTVSRTAFARLLGGDVTITPGAPIEEMDMHAAMATLAAEVALLEARLDDVQRELARITRLALPSPN
jgi:hypothetical protein